MVLAENTAGGIEQVQGERAPSQVSTAEAWRLGWKGRSLAVD